MAIPIRTKYLGVFTSDPTPTEVGQWWFRSDLGLFRIYNGSSTTSFPATPASLGMEGDYTTWTINGIYDTNIAFPMGTRDFLMIRNNGNVVFNVRGESYPYVNTTYIISPAGVLLATLPDECYLRSDSLSRCHYVHSLTGRYLLFISDDTADLIVQEGTVERWRRTVKDDEDVYSISGQSLYGPSLVAISPSGEWIAAVVYEDPNGLIFIYKGS